MSFDINTIKLLQDVITNFNNINVHWNKDEHNKLTLIIPNGYKYCNECKVFSPHVETSKHVLYCDVCETEKNMYYTCDHCGYDFSENGMSDPLENLSSYSYEVTVHHPGCHLAHTFKDPIKQFDEYLFNSGHIHFDLNSYGNRLLYKFIKNMTKEDKIKLAGRLQEECLLKCGCPSLMVIPPNSIVSYNEYHVTSFDCSNALEWDYELRCPICGEINEFSDGNC